MLPITHVWSIQYREDWPDFLGEIPAIAEWAHTAPRAALSGWRSDIVHALLIGGGSVGEVLQPFADLVPLALAEVAADAERGGLGTEALVHATLLCACQAAGCELPEGGEESVRRWLAGVDAPRDLPYAHWTKGLAALALDVPAAYRPAAGMQMKDPARFVPGETFGPQLQAFLAHLVGAVELGAAQADVEPAWRSLLAWYDKLCPDQLVDSAVLLWAGRVVHHRIGGQRLHTLADFLRDEVAAGMEWHDPASP